MTLTTTAKEGDGVKALGGITDDYYYAFRPDANMRSKGKLIAWDPIAQEERWHADRTLPLNGGILATGGNLVFQGTSDGKFEAFNAENGLKLWSFDTNASILAAPSTVLIDGKQLILVPSGNSGSAATRATPRLINTKQTRAPSRLLAFALDAKEALPGRQLLPFPEPVRPRQPAEFAKKGENLFSEYGCYACHGLHAEGSGPGIPDLRMLSKDKHGIFREVVVGGVLRSVGMPSFPNLKDEELEAIRAYLINKSWDAFAEQ